MITKIVKGDLIKLALEGKYNLIVHGCNCFNNMGAGIAKQIAKTWPEVAGADKKTTKGDKTKLGQILFVTTRDRIVVGNAYTQYAYGGGRVNVDYHAMESVFKILNSRCTISSYEWKIGIPMIGAGLAGGDWEKISFIIDKSTPDINIELVVL